MNVASTDITCPPLKLKGVNLTPETSTFEPKDDVINGDVTLADVKTSGVDCIDIILISSDAIPSEVMSHDAAVRKVLRSWTSDSFVVTI